MNDIWEDLISLTVIVLALAAYLVLLNTIFTNQMIQSAAAEKYRRTQGTADLLAAEWSYGTETGLLDPAKICVGCQQNTSVAVYDMRKKQKICECGSPINGTVIRLPAAVRYGEADIAPAEITVTMK
jgi:hypothetical protein